MIRSMTGSEVKYRQVWIDKSGDMGSFYITGPNKKTKKAQQQAKQAEKMKEQREKLKELLGELNNGSRTPEEAAYRKGVLKLISVDYRA